MPSTKGNIANTLEIRKSRFVDVADEEYLSRHFALYLAVNSNFGSDV